MFFNVFFYLQSNVFNIYASDVAPKFGPKRAPAWDMPVDWPSSDVGNVSVGWSVSADVIAIMCLRDHTSARWSQSELTQSIMAAE